MPATAPATTTPNSCVAFLRAQAAQFEKDLAERQALADQLGVSDERVSALLAASVLRPGVEWAEQEAGR